MLSSSSRTGKGNHGGNGVLGKRVADVVTCSDHDVQHAGRQPGFLINFRNEQTARNRRITAGFYDNRIPQSERRPDRTVREIHGGIPWADDPNNPNGLPINAALCSGFVDGQNASRHAMRKRSCLKGYRSIFHSSWALMRVLPALRMSQSMISSRRSRMMLADLSITVARSAGSAAAHAGAAQAALW